jgi:hypothetical protein
MCSITGNVVNADGSPLENGTITLNSQRIQVINSTPVNPTIITTNTDTAGNIRAFSVPQGLVMQITVCPPATGQGQSSNCAAPYSVFIPFSQTANFGQLSQGIQLSTSNSLSLDYLTVNKGVGIGQPVGNDPLDITKNVNGSTTVLVTNGNAGANTQAGFGATNLVSGVNLWLQQTGPAYSGNASLGPNEGYLYADEKLALLSGAKDGSPIELWASNIKAAEIEWNYPDAGMGGLRVFNNTSTGLWVGSATLTSVGGGNLNLMGGAYYNGTNWIATATGVSPLMNSQMGSFGFYRQPTTYSYAVGATLSAWVPASKFTGDWNFDHVISDSDVPAPTVSAGATLAAGSRDWAGEIILASTATYVDVTYSRCFPNQSWCVVTDDGEGLSWMVLNKGACSVRFQCIGCTAGAHYVDYICTGS